MKQVLQSLRTGKTEVTEVPCPAIGRSQVLIETSKTLLSVGTERSLVEFGKAGWIEKARQQPDKVRMVLDKISTDGLMPTIEAVFNKLEQPLPLGYCNVGRVLKVGERVSTLSIGDRVVSNGKHAEVVSVPMNLCARVPDVVSDDEAAFTVLAAIALQGIRLAKPTLGEAVVVTGLGLIGLVTVQLLRAHGCRVLGIDFDADKLNLARQFGAEVVNLATKEDAVEAAQLFSRGRGVDAVIITASTKSSEPLHQAAQMSRKRGRIVLVGVSGLELSRADFYEKELSFQVSCSYGPGRYDPNYEEKGYDYPFGFVRWTEQRNFEAVLDMMADGRLDVRPLISQRFPIAEAERAYALMDGATSVLGILLDYPRDKALSADRLRQTVILDSSAAPAKAPEVGACVCGFIGAGNYATSALIPAFKAAGAQLLVAASSGGVRGLHASRKFGFPVTTTDADGLLSNTALNCIVITTRHDSHARMVCDALRAGMHVFVEKPLALRIEELSDICDARREVSSLLMVGFNRRFAPQVRKIKQLLVGAIGPKAFVMTVNAGAMPVEHWTQDREVGGGRIIGEACHFIDLLRFLAGQPILSFHATAMDSHTRDSVSIQLLFADGSIGTILYLSNGNKSYPKERLEVFAAGGVLRLDNFRRLQGFGWPSFKTLNLWRQDKGQRACTEAFVGAVKSGSESPIPFGELIEVTRISIEIANSLR
jgi:predicted dehydrogenase/threonine dehydrogenase-like Zn-dependent dehydrogenase